LPLLRALLVILAILVAVPGLAAADKTVGLLVTGEYLKGPTQTQAEKWLRAQGQEAVTNALPNDATKTLLDCFVLDDPKCSKGIIDARATTKSFVSIRIDIVSKKDKDVRLTVDWFVKGHNPVTARRTCESCTESALRTTIDAMLLDLAKTSPGYMGRISVSSTPKGISVLVDNETIGVTPIERDIKAGVHKVRLVRDGRMGPEKDVKVEAGALAEITLEAPPEAAVVEPVPAGRPSRVLPISLIVVGGLAVGAGAGMYFVLHEEPTVDDFDSYNWKKPGVITAAAGGVVAVTGVIWILATKRSDGPTVGVTGTGDATIGWSGTF
jgi:hypothetical protein